jgi:hypothetical protein
MVHLEDGGMAKISKRIGEFVQKSAEPEHVNARRIE